MKTIERIGLKTADAIGGLGRNLTDVLLLPYAIQVAFTARRDPQVRRRIAGDLIEEVQTFGSLGVAGRVSKMFFPRDEGIALKQKVQEIEKTFRKRRYA